MSGPLDVLLMCLGPGDAVCLWAEFSDLYKMVSLIIVSQNVLSFVSVVCQFCHCCVNFETYLITCGVMVQLGLSAGFRISSMPHYTKRINTWLPSNRPRDVSRAT